MNERMVFVVDDDASIRNALCDMLEAITIPTKAFATATEYLGFRKPDIIACVLLDIHLPDTNGLELQEQLIGTDHPPIIFITGYGDVDSSVRALKAGAVDFLEKPFKDLRLVQAINEAFDRHARARAKRMETNELRSRYSRLTPRERDVLSLIVAGLLNKQAAAELGIREITCQVHRGQIMRKMAAGSLADLVRMASKLEIPLPAFSTTTGARAIA